MQMKRSRTHRTTRRSELRVAGVTLEAVIPAAVAGWAYRWDEAVLEWEELAGWVEEEGAEVRAACHKAAE